MRARSRTQCGVADLGCCAADRCAGALAESAPAFAVAASAGFCIVQNAQR